MTQNRLVRTAYLLPLLSLTALLSFSDASAAQSPAPSLTGNWKIHMIVGGNEQTQRCSFTQTDKALAGTCDSDHGDVKIAGTVDDMKATWKFDSEYNGTPITLVYTGVFDDKGKLTGSVEVQPFNVTGDFEVSAADAAAPATSGAPAAAASASGTTTATAPASAASAVSTSGAAYSVAGAWHVHTTVQGTDYESDCVIKQTDNVVGGTCKSEAGESKIAGSVDGNKATWKFDSEYQGTPINLTYTGAFDVTGKFSGTVDVAPFNVSGDFLMTPTQK